MRRREFVKGIASTAAWPLSAHAQRANGARRIGVLMPFADTDPEGRAQFSRFTQSLSELGWTDGRNLRIDHRWAADNVGRMRMLAKELVDLQPDLILSNTTPVTVALQRETKTIPILFVIVADPVGDGLITALPRPGGNITGFISIESTMGGKLPELLTQIAPAIKRIAIMFNPDTAAGGGSYFLPPFEAAARSLGLESVKAPVRNDAEIESVITSLGGEPRGGLVITPDGFMVVHRARTISLTARYKIPAVYFAAVFARDGGLLSYGPDRLDIFHRAASYVDRILRGEKPAELPVQLPVKYEMVLNTNTAKALDLAVPQSIILRADEVIE